MLRSIIDFSLKNKFIVLLGTIVLVVGGLYALKNIPLDAIPDQSDVQVIVYTEWPGQARQIVQDQVTYPITTKMLSVPKAKVVRGYIKSRMVTLDIIHELYAITQHTIYLNNVSMDEEGTVTIDGISE